LRHGTFPRWILFIPAATNFFRDPQFTRVRFFGFWRRSAATFQPWCRFFGPLTGFTMARSLGTFSCSASDSISSGFALRSVASDFSWCYFFC
jgi:hypothetical protein